MVTPNDEKILRVLSQRVHNIAQMPEQQTLRDLWKKHTALKGTRPPVFVSPEGSWAEILPDASLKCETAFARQVERELRQRIFRFEHIHDDTPIEDDYDFPVSSIPVSQGWGAEPERVFLSDRGAWRYKPIIKEAKDWKKLKMPVLQVDAEGAKKRTEVLQNIAGDNLKVHTTGIKIFDFHIAHIYCDFRGLEYMFMDLVDEPDMVDDVFSFIGEGLEGLVHQAQKLRLIETNNDYTYHYTGGLGYNEEMTAKKMGEADVMDVWAAAEAQEFSCVSPEMFAETIFPHEKRLLEMFGINGYGCCDDLTEKLDTVLTIPRLRRVAACPWANLAKMADKLKKNYILTWKPNPAMLAGEYFDDEFVEETMYKGLTDAKEGYPEIILRDTHSCRNDPSRFEKFVRAARKAMNRVYGEE